MSSHPNVLATNERIQTNNKNNQNAQFSPAVYVCVCAFQMDYSPSPACNSFILHNSITELYLHKLRFRLYRVLTGLTLNKFARPPLTRCCSFNSPSLPVWFEILDFPTDPQKKKSSTKATPTSSYEQLYFHLNYILVSCYAICSALCYQTIKWLAFIHTYRACAATEQTPKKNAQLYIMQHFEQCKQKPRLLHCRYSLFVCGVSSLANEKEMKMKSLALPA